MNLDIVSLSRRRLLDRSWRFLAAAGVGAAGKGFAAGAPVDRALVCIYLNGGNDSNNLLVPMDQYDSYAAARGGLALNSSSLLMVRDSLSQDRYGFHPAMPEVRDLFESGALAVVANVGNVSSTVPEPQMRHADPGLAYLAGARVLPGWAASLARSASSSMRGMAVELSDTSVSLLATGANLPESAAKGLAAAWRNPKDVEGFSETGLGNSLRRVAAVLAESSRHGLQRPVFFVPMSGFATVADQMPRHEALLRELSAALGKFQETLSALGLAQRVTTFTDTECSRTLQPNQGKGSNAAWGGHHLVLGGATLGGRIYGKFPQLRLGSTDDADRAGTWIPTLAKDQYAATFANWFGVPYSELNRHLPGLRNDATRTLGFLT